MYSKQSNTFVWTKKMLLVSAPWSQWWWCRAGNFWQMESPPGITVEYIKDVLNPCQTKHFNCTQREDNGQILFVSLCCQHQREEHLATKLFSVPQEILAVPTVLLQTLPGQRCDDDHCNDKQIHGHFKCAKLMAVERGWPGYKIGMKKDAGKLGNNWNSLYMYLLCIYLRGGILISTIPPTEYWEGFSAKLEETARVKDTTKWFINPICSDIQVALGHVSSKYSHNEVQVHFGEQAGISYKVRCLQATSIFFWFCSIPSLTDNQLGQLHFTKSLLWLTTGRDTMFAKMWGIQSKKKVQMNKRTPTMTFRQISKY